MTLLGRRYVGHILPLLITDCKRLDFALRLVQNSAHFLRGRGCDAEAGTHYR